MHGLSATNPLYSLSGFAVGMLVGLTGVGGGSLMTPLLILLFGIHPVTAVGTDLLYAAATKSVGTFVHGIGKTIEWRLTFLLALGSIPAAAATLLFEYAVGRPSAIVTHVMTVVLGVALLLTAVSLLMRARIEAFALRRGAPSARRATALTVVTGVALGVLVSLTSVGAGALGVTVLILLYPRLPLARIIGSDIAHAVPLTLLAGVGHWIMGDVNWGLLGALLVGSVPGIVVGSLLATRVPERVLRPLLAATLVLVGGKLLG